MARASGISLKSKPRLFALPGTNDGVCEIVADFDARKARTVSFTLSNKAGEHVDFTYDAGARTVTVDRRQSGITDFSESFPAVTVAPTFESSGKISLRIFVDRSSTELFGNDGRFVLTNLVFPTEPYTTLSVKAEGGTAQLASLKIYSIKE